MEESRETKEKLEKKAEKLFDRSDIEDKRRQMLSENRLKREEEFGSSSRDLSDSGS